ncbi:MULTISPECIES: MarR family winged helix-turn-helix transcriptional regulator [Microbacterium]|jgi:DNA-binding MarR family transcriptional regulator|uniref:Transcriptional repressor MprA n=1 Tax=Microbacterium ginsengisoli TaxID=400772 RepID=A0A0F0LNQ4_9MICO|nr:MULTISPECIES: MarR family transcriptional regulator [Microbacterium]KJL34852.1 Transcriptional repressor MprA [Microbacterium ginsengisoli]KJL35063.1 Transcriptional repressor MprA [Microbacterium ginsengisoli]MBN9207660.1 MarR family transcriptional regulator [Microbacterium ginsengisoli]MCK9915004.1 MarR family transcriptional regulator [Microbacteriaceae bacterium K1510]
MPTTEFDDSGYWYADTEDARRARAVHLLQAFRLYRAAEVAMRRRTREAMSMGENDLLVLRYLLKAQQEGRSVSPGELSRYLGTSTAAVTAIIDRLERSNHVRRERHESDRRSIYVVPTAESDDEVRRTLGDMHDRMLDAVIDLSPDDTLVVLDTLARLQAAVDQVQPGAHAGARR